MIVSRWQQLVSTLLVTLMLYIIPLCCYVLKIPQLSYKHLHTQHVRALLFTGSVGWCSGNGLGSSIWTCLVNILLSEYNYMVNVRSPD